MKPPRTSIALVLAFWAAWPARADEIDSYLGARLRSLHIPGASLAIVRGGRIVKAFADRAFGAV